MPERRGGAGDGRATRRRRARGDGTPLYAKLSPAQWDIAEAARAVVDAGADGLSLVNTIRGLALDPATLRPKLARGAGGYSGPALGRSRSPASTPAPPPSTSRSSEWGRRRRGSTRSSSSRSGRARSRSGRSCSSDPLAPGRIRAELDAEAAARGFATLARREVLLSIRKNPANRPKQYCLIHTPRVLDSCAHGHVEDARPGPARSLDQRMEALQRANDIRVRRAQLKKDLKDGRAHIESILLDPPDYVSTAKVFDMLMAVPKFGRVKAARLLNQCRISQSKTVGGLSERQRAELVNLFNNR